MFIGQVVFRVTDTYFMYQQEALGKCAMVFFILMVFNLVARIYCFVAPPKHQTHIEQYAKSECKILKNWAAWAAAYPPALCMSTFIFCLCQWEYLQN